MTDATDDALTIDELARRTGMTVRNIRAHQSRGLLPAPEVRGRTGFYGPEHVGRIELIRELQDEGFNLAAIQRLVEGPEGSSAEVLRFARAVREPFEDEAPEIVTLEELAERWGDRAGPRLLQRVIELGLLRKLGDGRFEELSPRLSRAGAELADMGISPDTAADVIAALRTHAEGIAERFVRLFLDEVWTPFEEAGRPPERWREVRDALERLRPLAAESVLSVFQLAMSDAVDEAFGRELARIRREAEDAQRGAA
ncbi:MAG TPA: MerR family transcriptional regulator [Solirubrobacteraceae bacterium]|nr:MerR family transcriptional regulator [Solirubrobacteraceae bacterium]